PQQSQHLQGSQAVSRPKHDDNLWSMPITRMSRTISLIAYAENFEEMEDVVFEEENISNLDVSNIEVNTSLQNELYYFFRSLLNKIEQAIDQEMIEDMSDEDDDKLLVNLDNNNFEPEDLQKAMLDDVLDSIEGVNKLKYIVEWPNDTYKNFMELIIE
ncbi:32708_t:CDS:1, partial [Racocetra persica]